MNSGNLFVRRPKPGETEEDILALQNEWNTKNAQQMPATQIKKMQKKGGSNSEKKNVPSRSSEKFDHPARFTIDLEKIAEENPAPVIFGVQEKNFDYVLKDRSEEIIKQGLERLKYSKDEGFPDILDLRDYFATVGNKKLPAPKKSFFATEFDRLHGIIDDSSVPFVPVEEPEDDKDDNPYAENEEYVKSLSTEKIVELRKEIEERLDPKMVQFLKDRFKKKVENPNAPKVSKFKQAKIAQTKTEAAEKPVEESSKDTSTCGPSIKEQNTKNFESPPTTSTTEQVTDDLIKQLEVLDEFADREDTEKYNRLATDAVQIDFATKCLRTMLPRQQQNAIKLFESLKAASTISPPNKLLDLARTRIDDIKQLYLEEVSIDGKNQMQFARGSNPLMDSCWTLRPVRAVLDVQHKREIEELTDDDLDIVQLSLLWTVMLFLERPTAFYSFAEPNEMYVRLAECFLLGNRLLEDDVSIECITLLFDSYILKCALDGRLSLRMNNRVAELDAFMPFFEDFLKHFESYSLGDQLFSQFIIAGAYLNTARSDSLECRFAIWSPKMTIARQMTLNVEGSTKIIDAITEQRSSEMDVFEEQHYVAYCSLLGVYTAALRDRKVTRDRNPLLFKIASEELGAFVKRHSKTSCSSQDKSKEFDTLVTIIRTSLKDIISF